VCINSINFRGTRDDDVMKAMYGSHQINFPPDPNVWNETILNISSYKGYFESNSEAKRGLTGVFVTNVCPFNLHDAKYWLCLNPYSAFTLDFDNLSLGYFRKELQKLHGVKGKTCGFLLYDLCVSLT
jgi:hypothetical protein